MSPRKAVLFAALVVLSGVVLVRMIRVPATVRSDAPSGNFSGANAYRHLEFVAREPRRMYQPHYERVQQHVIDELAQYGIPATIQRSTALEPRARIFYSSVENIVAVIKGTSDTADAILIAAHLDSEPHIGPGAADNGGGVASLLELARALKHAGPLRNDVILLFSVPEECGMQGCVAFVKEHPLAPRVRLVLNCDGMGTGNYILTNSTRENDLLVAGLAQSCPELQAYSYVSSATPVSSRDDLVFRLAGYPTLDFSSAHYQSRLWHSRYDNIGIISPAGLEENGTHLLALLGHFGNLDLRSQSTDETVFFSVLQIFVIRYPMRFVIPLHVLSAVLTAALLWAARRRNRLSLKGTGIAIVTIAAALLLAAGTVRALWLLVTRFHPMYQFLFNNASYNCLLIYLGSIALSGAVLVAVIRFKPRALVFSHDELASAVLCVLFVLSTVSLAISPHFAAVIVWMQYALLALLTARLFAGNAPAAAVIAEYMVAGAAVVLLLPAVVAQYLSGEDEPFRLVSALLFFISLLPLFYNVLVQYGKTIVAMLALCCIAILVPALTDGFRAGHPRVTYVSCIADGDSGTAVWYVRNLYRTDLDDYSKQFLSAGQQPDSIRKLLPSYPYNVVGLFTLVDTSIRHGPVLAITRDSVAGEFRFITADIKSLRNAWEIAVFKNPDLEVLEYAVDGKPCVDQFSIRYTNSDDRVLFLYRNPRAAGITLTMKVRTNRNIVLTVRDRTYGIPMRPGMTPMPDTMIPWIDYGAGTTSVIRTYPLPAAGGRL